MAAHRCTVPNPGRGYAEMWRFLKSATANYPDVTDKNRILWKRSFRRVAETNTRAACAPQTSLRREGSDEVFEAWVATQRIPKREQFQQAIAKHSRHLRAPGKLFQRKILLANPRRADGLPLNHQRPIECIFLRRQKLDRAATFA